MIATMACISCSELTPQPEEKEYDYVFDVEKSVDCNYFEGVSGETVLNVKANLPFESTIYDGRSADFSCDVSGRPEFVITADEIERIRVNGEYLSLTRDILVHVRPLEICRIKGFNWFNYPVLIRQRGGDGTLYLTAEEVRAFNTDRSSSWNWLGKSNQHYIKGKVVSLEEVKPFDGVASGNGLFIFPLAPGQSSMYSDKPWNLEAAEMTVEVDGERILLTAIYEKPYNLVRAMCENIRQGDMIEVNVSARGILDKCSGIFVHPLSVRKIGQKSEVECSIRKN